MAQMNISIPDKLKAWVESRVADGDYASTSDYLRDLVRQDQRERERLEWLRAEIQAGFDSGVSDVDPFAQIEELKQSLATAGARKDAA
jgi:antitoxin ParD1/3/4